MIYDSSSTTGAGLSGLVHNSSGLKAYYRIGATGASTAITLATQTATGAWSSGGFVEIDATNMKGVYRLDLPNAVAATAAMVSLYLYGATNMMAVAQRVDCRAVPVDLKLIAGQTANAAAAVTFPATIASTTNITSASGITVSTNNDKTGYSLATAPPTSSAIATAVWGSLTTANWGANSFGNFVLISNNSNRSVFVTGAGSGHIASDVHEMQPNVLNASALATDAVTEIRSAILTAMYVDGETNKIKVNADNSVNSTGGGGSGGTVTGFSAEALAQLAPTITVVQPLVTINSTTGLPMRIEIVQGADYNSTDGTSISLTMTGTFPAWTGATAYLDIDCGTTLSVTGSITTATGSTRVITFNLTAAQTALLTDATQTRNEIVSDAGWFDVRVVLASSSRVMKPVSKAVFVARRPA
jgi:hypothetical protein